MSDTERPNLTLGDPPKGLKVKAGKSTRTLLILILLLQAAVLIFLFISHPGNPVTALKDAIDPVPADFLKAVALELEEKSLNQAAAEAWERHLEASPFSSERPQILYRMGKLYMEAGDYEKAAGAFVGAELAGEGDTDLGAKIGPKMVACLRNLGRYGEVGRELSRRVEMGASGTGRGRTLATFASEALTEADVDRMIERRVDQVLAMQGGRGDERQRAALLRQMEQPGMREQIFQEMLQAELFNRRARELGLDQEEEYLKAKDLLLQNLLASRFLDRALEKIRPTEVDIEAFYQAFKEDYREPEKIKALTIGLEEGEEAEVLLEKIHSPEDFRAVAAEREGGEAVPLEIQKGAFNPQLGAAATLLFDLEAGTFTKSPIENDGKQYLALVEAKVPARLPDLEEIRDRIREDYRSRKSRELLEELSRDLMARYEVTIVAKPGEAKGGSGGETEKGDRSMESTEKNTDPGEQGDAGNKVRSERS